MSDMENAIGLRQGQLGSALGSGAKAQAEDEYMDVYEIDKAAADAMASTTTAETGGPSFMRAGIVKRIEIDTEADAAEHADNHATITVSKRDAAAGNKATLGTYTTDTGVSQGTLTKWVTKAFALTEANLVVVRGGKLTYEIAKGGTGVVVPVSRIRIYVLPTDKSAAV